MTRSRSAAAVFVAVCAAVSLVAGCSTTPGHPTLSRSAVPTPVAPSEAPEEFARVIASSNVDAQRYAYPVADGRGDDSQNWVDVFLPKGDHDDGSLPLVVLIHGGAWQSQIGADVFVSFARRLAERGLAVYNVEYRRVGSGGGYPQTFADVAAAVDYIPEIAKVNPSIKLDDAVVVGHSAGGQLAGWVGTRHRLDDNEVGSKPKYRPTSVVSLAGPLDMITAVDLGDDRIVKALGGTPDEVPDRYTSVDPIQNIDPTIPVIAMAGSDDHVVPPVISRNYVAAAKKAGADARYVEFPHTNHVTIVDPAHPSFLRVLETISREAHT